MDDNKTTPHIIMVPSPGMGHLIPLIQFAKRLNNLHNFTISFIIPTNGPPTSSMKSTVAALPNSISTVFLPHVNLDDLSPNVRAETVINLTIFRSLPALREAVSELLKTRKIVALISDLFGTDTFDVAFEFNIKPHIFYTSTAMCLSLFLHLAKLHEAVSCEFREMDEPVTIPGCVPVHGSELLDPLQDRKDDAYRWVLHHSKRYTLAEGIMVNSFTALESGAIKALQEPGIPPVYPIGPIIQTGVANRDEVLDGSKDCLNWLDNQPSGSVLFVSFGSGGTLSHAQMIEVALGLEASEERFLWVVRIPNDTAANATFFDSHGAKKSDDPLNYLPNGFLERIKGRGLVVPNWAPQVQILNHGSTDGFLSHCGWNSTLESIVHGVPMIAWPLYAEQKMNAGLLTKDLKVALRPRAGDDGVVGRGEVMKVVKSLMEGEEGKVIRNRMKDLKDAAIMTLSEEGESTKGLSQLVSKWKDC